MSVELQLGQDAAVLNLPLPYTFSGIPTDEEQATGLERRTLQALKLGKVGYYTRKYTVLYLYKYSLYLNSHYRIPTVY